MPGAPMFVKASRPKIHRLPALPPETKTVPVFPKKQIVIGGGGALALLILAVVSTHLFSQAKPTETAPVPVETTANSEDKTIVLRNENQVIIGQMAHIASPATPPAEVSTMSAPPADQRQGKELLSIINQY